MLSLDQVQDHALEVEQCQQMMLDAFEGEQKLNYTEAHREHLWRLLQGGELIAPVPPLPPRRTRPSEPKPTLETPNVSLPAEQATLPVAFPHEETPAVPVKKTRTRKKPTEHSSDETIQAEAGEEASAVDPPKRRRKKATEPVAETVETDGKIPPQADPEASVIQVDAATTVPPTKPKRTRRVGEPKPKRYPVGEPERERSI